MMRQARSIHLTILSNLFVLAEATQVMDLRRIMYDLRIKAMANFIARAPRNSKEVILVSSRINIVALRVHFNVTKFLNRDLITVARSITFSVNFNRRV